MPRQAGPDIKRLRPDQCGFPVCERAPQRLSGIRGRDVVQPYFLRPLLQHRADVDLLALLVHAEQPQEVLVLLSPGVIPGLAGTVARLTAVLRGLLDFPDGTTVPCSAPAHEAHHSQERQGDNMRSDQEGSGYMLSPLQEPLLHKGFSVPGRDLEGLRTPG